MKEKIKMLIKSAKSITLCADFWTGKDGIGYLGVTASFLVEDERRNLMICLQHVEHPHTGQVVRDSIDNALSEYDLTLDDPKVVSISTDNGSNMVSGLKNLEETIENSNKNCPVVE